MRLNLRIAPAPWSFTMSRRKLGVWNALASNPSATKSRYGTTLARLRWYRTSVASSWSSVGS